MIFYLVVLIAAVPLHHVIRMRLIVRQVQSMKRCDDPLHRIAAAKVGAVEATVVVLHNGILVGFMILASLPGSGGFMIGLIALVAALALTSYWRYRRFVALDIPANLHG